MLLESGASERDLASVAHRKTDPLVFFFLIVFFTDFSFVFQYLLFFISFYVTV